MPSYLVFGRTEFEQPLSQRGTVDADDERHAADETLARFGERWVELSLIPSGDVRWILGPDPAGDEGEGS